MTQGKHNTVHKYGGQKRKRSKQLANARAKKNCIEPLKDVSQNNDDNKENLTDEYESDSTIMYTPDKPKLTSRTEEKLSTMANAIPSCHSTNPGGPGGSLICFWRFLVAIMYVYSK